MEQYKIYMDSLAAREKKPLALYIHIPFCARKCAYCDFLSFPLEETKIRAYMEQLRKELLFRSIKPSGTDCDSQSLLQSPYEIVSIFFQNYGADSYSFSCGKGCGNYNRV